ncbi:hypothetical protein Sxan_24080 [Streptomyces xanthophaeus]|uniref:Uncharacterized protein n=1 Tax=Streptomyces xanthophaeus TaxID=67385 RepID=A0A919H0C5_9ACTN|nr:hypothetical protein Sxan_24080 [Streptomyces xanthophaeus]
MNQREWKPDHHRRGVERVAATVLAVAAAVFAAAAIAIVSIVLVYTFA